MDPFFGQQIPAEGNLDLHRSAFRAPGFGSLQKKSPPSLSPPAAMKILGFYIFQEKNYTADRLKKAPHMKPVDVIEMKALIGLIIMRGLLGKFSSFYIALFFSFLNLKK